jgi:hypothetical protein
MVLIFLMINNFELEVEFELKPWLLVRELPNVLPLEQ